MTRDDLIEKAKLAIKEADSGFSGLDTDDPAYNYPDEDARWLRAMAEAALSVFEESQAENVRDLPKTDISGDRMPVSAHAPTSDEREALAVLISEYINETDDCGDLPHTRGLAEQIISEFRRSEVPEPSADDRDEISDEALWDFAGDLLDAWNIEDTNAPSLAEDFRDRFVARFHASYRTEPQGEPSDAVEFPFTHEGVTLEQDDGGMVVFDRGGSSYWISPRVLAALRAAAAVRGTGGEQ